VKLEEFPKVHLLFRSSCVADGTNQSINTGTHLEEFISSTSSTGR